LCRPNAYFPYIPQTIVSPKKLFMKKVADVLSRKGHRVTMVSPNDSVLDALKIMADQNIGSVVVTENEKYLGIMTERDYSRKVVLKGKSSTDTTVGEIMSDDLPRVAPNDTIEYCMQLMSDRNLRYLPVFEKDHLSGILSINDVVKETILAQQETITQLKDYLHASM
jgi:CBS domain-containing protein